MSVRDMISSGHHTSDVVFIHNCFGTFFSGVLNWFGSEFYPRFNYKVIGSYDKAVQHFNEKKKHGGTPTSNILPSVSLDPIMDFSNDEQAGRFFWQFSRYAPGIGMRLWNSINMKEQDVIITPVYSRYQGTFEVTFWLSSIYELMDFRVKLLQFCGGFNRWCRPEIFWSYIILPDEIAKFTRENGEKLDWNDTLSDIIHVDTMNKRERVIPTQLDPMWRLESFSDASTKYGSDSIAEYKLTATFGYEVNLPTYFVLSEHIDPSLVLNLSMGSAFTKYPLVSPYRLVRTMINEGVDLHELVDDHFNFYKIEDDAKEVSNRILECSSDSIRYPESIEEWNYITSGTLKYITDDVLTDDSFNVRRGDIVCMDSYKDVYLPFIRKASAVVCKYAPRTGILYEKCKIMNKPCICLLTDDEFNTIIGYDDSVITLDPRSRRFYSDELSVCINDANNVEMSFEILEQIKDTMPEIYDDYMKKFHKDRHGAYNLPSQRAYATQSEFTDSLVVDYTDGITKEYQLNFILDDADKLALIVYVNDDIIHDGYEIIGNNILSFSEPPERGSKIHVRGNLFIVKESKLFGIYEFTEDDIDADEILVDLPRSIDDLNDIILVSYIGTMELERDFTLQSDNTVANIRIKPKVGEIIQFFYYIHTGAINE